MSAVKHGNLQVLRWWLRWRLHCYLPDQKNCGLGFVLERAIREAQFPILEWIHQETQGHLPPLTSAECYGSSDVIYWLYDHGGRHLPVKFSILSVQTDARCEFIKWCIERGGECNKYFDIPIEILKSAAEHGLEMLQQLMELWPVLCTPVSLNYLVENGNFEAIKWLAESRPTRYFSDIRLHSAAFNGNPEAVRWIAFDFTWKYKCGRLAWIHGAIHFAVCNGDFEMFHSFSNLRQQIVIAESIREDTLNPNLIDEAVRRGHLEIAQWLQDHGSRWCSSSVVDDVANNGNLESIKWLHQNLSQAFTKNTMNYAAACGHLEMIQWLHTNRNEGCTTDAMDYAAAHDHLEALQWLHENRSEGCTTSAMDLASRYGHLEVIRWLHENRTEGCTTDAMDWTASHGDVNILQFLHTHRTEGCTIDAMNGSAEFGYLDAFKWLHENRSEGCSDEALRSYFSDILEYMALHTTYFSLDRIVDALALRRHYGPIDLILRQTRAKELDFALSVYVDRV